MNEAVRCLPGILSSVSRVNSSVRTRLIDCDAINSYLFDTSRGMQRNSIQGRPFCVPAATLKDYTTRAARIDRNRILLARDTRAVVCVCVCTQKIHDSSLASIDLACIMYNAIRNKTCRAVKIIAPVCVAIIVTFRLIVGTRV